MLQVDMQLVPPQTAALARPSDHPQLQYAPILLDRRGERTALSNLPAFVWDRMTPMIRLAPANDEERNKRVTEVGEWTRALAKSVRGHPLYLDPQGVETSNRRASSLLSALYDAARLAGIAFMPVHTLGVSTTASPAVGAASRDRRGLALRYRLASHMAIGSHGAADLVAAEVQMLGVGFDQVDLFVDLGWIRPNDDLDPIDLSPILQDIRQLGNWRRVVLVGTCVPETLADYREGIVSSIPRRERDIWETLRAMGHSELIYGDYGIQNPKPPLIGTAPKMRAGVRYSTPKGILVSRGEAILSTLTQAEREHEYQLVCERLFLHDLYAEDCCPADTVIRECSDGLRKVRTQHDWRNFGTGHHAHTVVYELQRLEARIQEHAADVAASPRGTKSSRRARDRVSTPGLVRTGPST